MLNTSGVCPPDFVAAVVVRFYVLESGPGCLRAAGKSDSLYVEAGYRRRMTQIGARFMLPQSLWRFVTLMRQ